jgi:hypothetical protein
VLAAATPLQQLVTGVPREKNVPGVAAIHHPLRDMHRASILDSEVDVMSSCEELRSLSAGTVQVNLLLRSCFLSDLKRNEQIGSDDGELFHPALSSFGEGQGGVAGGQRARFL